MCPKDIEYKINLLTSPINECDKMIVENSMQFEHKITYIGAGAIGVIFLFSKDNGDYLCLFFVGVLLLLFACIMNLYSYIWYNKKLRKDSDYFYDIRCALKYYKEDKTSNIYYKANKEFIEKSNEEFQKDIVDRINLRCKKADNYNKYNLFILFLGFIVITIYVALNLK